MIMDFINLIGMLCGGFFIFFVKVEIVLKLRYVKKSIEDVLKIFWMLKGEKFVVKFLGFVCVRFVMMMNVMMNRLMREVIQFIQEVFFVFQIVSNFMRMRIFMVMGFNLLQFLVRLVVKWSLLLIFVLEKMSEEKQFVYLCVMVVLLMIYFRMMLFVLMKVMKLLSLMWRYVKEFFVMGILIVNFVQQNMFSMVENFVMVQEMMIVGLVWFLVFFFVMMKMFVFIMVLMLNQIKFYQVRVCFMFILFCDLMFVSFLEMSVCVNMWFLSFFGVVRSVWWQLFQFWKDFFGSYDDVIVLF